MNIEYYLDCHEYAHQLELSIGEIDWSEQLSNDLVHSTYVPVRMSHILHKYKEHLPPGIAQL